MKFRGRLAPRSNGSEPSPHIYAEVILSGRDRRGDIDFLIDTGADRTIISALDLDKLNVVYGALTDNITVVGLAGAGKGKLVRAMIRLSATDTQTIRVVLDLVIVEPSAENEHFGSLLGRDLLRDFTFTMDHPRQHVELEIPPDSPTWERISRESATDEPTLKLPMYRPQPPAHPVSPKKSWPRH